VKNDQKCQKRQKRVFHFFGMYVNFRKNAFLHFLLKNVKNGVKTFSAFLDSKKWKFLYFFANYCIYFCNYGICLL